MGTGAADVTLSAWSADFVERQRPGGRGATKSGHRSGRDRHTLTPSAAVPGLTRHCTRRKPPPHAPGPAPLADRPDACAQRP